MKYVLTGTAYTGKTVARELLAARGHITIPEAETLRMRELADVLGPELAGCWVRQHYTELKGMVADTQRQLERIVVAASRPVFADRAAPCYLGYCKLRNRRAPDRLLALAEETQPKRAFFFEQLGHFSERRETGRFMTAPEATQLATLIWVEYAARGIPLTVVPDFGLPAKENTARRVEFIESVIRGEP